jgi:hypothetical protein
MDRKSKITKKILSDTILPNDAIDLIIDKLNENEKKLEDKEYLESLKISFGKHRGKTYGFLARNYPTYIIWLYNKEINPFNDINRKVLRHFYYLAVDYNEYNKRNRTQYIPNLRF